MRFSFQCPGKPVGQGAMRSLGPRRMVHANAETLHPWREKVAWAARVRIPDEWDDTGPMAVDAIFHIPRPKKHYLAAGLRPDAPWWPTNHGTGDCDHYARALLDALTQAGVWRDDSQVVHITAQKHYHDGPGLLVCAVERLTEKHQERGTG